MRGSQPLQFVCSLRHMPRHTPQPTRQALKLYLYLDLSLPPSRQKRQPLRTSRSLATGTAWSTAASSGFQI